MCKRMGTQTWVAITLVLTEALIVCKFDWNLISQPFPTHVVVCWSIFLICLLIWMVWQFYLKPHLHLNFTNKKEKNK
jgi:hypothetical protein